MTTRNGGLKPERRRVIVGRRFGSGRGIVTEVVILAVLVLVLLLPLERDVRMPALILSPVVSNVLAIEVVLWLRRRMDQPVTQGRATCCVCKKQKPHRLRLLPDDESGPDAWWRECPECHAHYCENHKGLLWMSDERGTGLQCLECGCEWTIWMSR